MINEDVLNVWDESLPEFDAASIGAKYKAIKHKPMTDAESHTWNRIQELIGRFQRANRIVLGLPMWNFSIPYKLKQLIDLTGPASTSPRHSSSIRGDLDFARILQYHRRSITKRLTLIFGFVS